MTTIAHTVSRPPVWRRLVGFNLLTGIILGAIGYWLGYLIGSGIHGAGLAYYDDVGQNDVAVLLGYFLGVVGFLVGLGFANYPIRRMLGHPPTLAEHFRGWNVTDDQETER